MTEQEQGVPQAVVNTKELFLCPTHGMIEPGRFDRDWTDERGCPVPTCEEPMQPVDLSPALKQRGEAEAIRAQLLADVREALEKLDRFSFQPSDDPEYNGMIGDEDGSYVKRSAALATLAESPSEDTTEEASNVWPQNPNDLLGKLQASFERPSEGSGAPLPEAAGHDFKVPAPSLAMVLAHFESEAKAADELILAEDGDTPLRRRYEVERDTYRYVLEQIRSAQPLPEGEKCSEAEIRELAEEELGRVEGVAWDSATDLQKSVWLNRARARLSPGRTDLGELTPDECRELFSLWINHGMQPPEIDPGHPLYTGGMKLGASQPHPEDDDPGRPLALSQKGAPLTEGEKCEHCGGRGFNFGTERDGMLRCEACPGTGKKPPPERGHFEVYPRRYTDADSEGHPDDLRCSEKTGDWGWRYRDPEGTPRAHSEGGFDTPLEAKLGAARFIIATRQSTYGVRFEAELADAVVVVD